MSNRISKIATETIAELRIVFAGQTVSDDVVYAHITQVYTLARKRTGMTSFADVLAALHHAGVTRSYTGPNYTGDCFYTFPAVAA